MIPAITAIGVASSRKSAGTPGSRGCRPRIGELSLRMSFHEIVRSRKLVKNGATTRNSSRFFWRPALNAMAYASG